MLSAVNKLILTQSMNLIRMQLHFIQSDFKSEYLFFTCSAATDLVTSLNDPFQSVVLLFSVTLANYGTVPFSFILFTSAALQEAVLQANTEQSWKKVFKMWNQAVEMRNRPRTSLILVQNVSKRIAVKFQERFRQEIMNLFKKISSNLMNINKIFVIWENFWSFCSLKFIVSAQEDAFWDPLQTD